MHFNPTGIPNIPPEKDLLQAIERTKELARLPDGINIDADMWLTILAFMDYSVRFQGETILSAALPLYQLKPDLDTRVPLVALERLRAWNLRTLRDDFALFRSRPCFSEALAACSFAASWSY